MQEISDSDDGTLEAGATTVSSAVVVPWASASLETPTVNVGHQRAALELRNLSLEREASATGGLYRGLVATISSLSA